MRSRRVRVLVAAALVGLVGGALASSGTSHAAPGAASPSRAEAAGIDSLDALFAVLARSPGFFARFHEEKQVTLLVMPLKSDGTIHFDKAHGLARHTLTPHKESVLLSGSTLAMWDGTKTETVSLQSSAPLRALAESFALLLAADRAGLEKSFTLSFQATGSSWRLALVPTLADLRKLVTEVDIAGDALTPKTLVVREASGDESTTTLSDADLGKHYSAREAAAVFKVPPSAP